MALGGFAGELDRLAFLFADIASEAGVAVMEVYASDFVARRKADSSPVSDADERAEAIILERLARELPGVPAVAEESAATSRHGAGGPLLLIDPVDGTREFVKRNGEFSVNIALSVDGVAVAGAIYGPVRGEMTCAGATAFALDGLPPGAPPRREDARTIRTRPYPEEGLTAIVSRSHGDARTRDFLAPLPLHASVSLGSSLKFALIARGQADVYPRFGRTMEWDTAAGHAILNAAGGSVVDVRGAPLVYGKDAAGWANDSFIAWGGPPLR